MYYVTLPIANETDAVRIQKLLIRYRRTLKLDLIRSHPLRAFRIVRQVTVVSNSIKDLDDVIARLRAGQS